VSNAFASAFEISAKIIRHHLADPETARHLIVEFLDSTADNLDRQGNGYLRNTKEGYKAVISGLYAIAQRSEL
jgi:hypothetical protein